jgi:hypothetical protein
MIKEIKHKIAFLLCLVFISRIMFVQIGIFYVSGSGANKQVNQPVLSVDDQKVTHYQSEDQLKSGNYWAMEILEANSDAGSKFKPFILPVIPAFFDAPVAGLKNILRSFQFTGVLSFVSQQRYLALGVFRI